MRKSNRIDWIDFAKGFTILLVVLGHVTLGMYESNRFLAYQEDLLLFTQLIYIYHIPVFFALSGFFFKSTGNFRVFGRQTLQKLLAFAVPYVFYSIVLFVLQNIGGSSVRHQTSIMDLLSIYYKPLSVSWYLYVLFFIIVTVSFLSIFIKNKGILFIIFTLGFLLSLLLPSDVYIVQKVLLWAFFFVFGYVINDNKVLSIINSNKKLIVASALVIISIFFIIWWKSNPTEYVSYDSPGLWGLIFVVSVPLAFVIYPKLMKLNILNSGKYFFEKGKDSLVIYLVHAPVCSIARIALLKLGVDNVFIHIILGLAAGWFVSVFVIYLIRKIPYLDFVFYPTKYIK